MQSNSREVADAGASDGYNFDTFISYSSRDREYVTRLASGLEARGIRVWWDGHITTGQRWDDVLDKHLRSARTILALITENIESNERDYIYEEMKFAREHNKLFPVFVKGADPSFAIRGLISRLQQQIIDDLSSLLSPSSLDALAAKLGETPQNEGLENKHSLSQELSSIESWYSEIETKYSPGTEVYLFSHALALSCFENALFTGIQTIADRLSKRIADLESLDGPVPDNDLPKRRAPLLRILQCQTKVIDHPAWGLNQEIVEFSNPNKAINLMSFFWSEFAPRRRCVIEWWSELISKCTVGDRMRLAYAIGALAQTNFVDIYNEVLSRWLFQGSAQEKVIADIAMSVAAFEPRTREAIKDLIEKWSSEGSIDQTLVAIRLACGFSGSRFPGLAIQVLKTVTERGKGKMGIDLFETMTNSIENILELHSSDEDNSLFDLPGLVAELSKWAVTQVGGRSDVDEKLSNNPYPLILLLRVFHQVPLQRRGRMRSRVSLDVLVRDDVCTRHTAGVLNQALARQRIAGLETRPLARAVLRRWIAQKRVETPDAGEQDPLLRLAREMASMAQEADDRERILNLFDGVYSQETLRHATEVPPTIDSVAGA